ncbi:MAG: hypothetical protein OJF59_000320 [Cytophagales bacterium]|nr:MAG: hypothetical protein OJF59_000320 [Cytophagales bacterium]
MPCGKNKKLQQKQNEMINGQNTFCKHVMITLTHLSNNSAN